MYFVINAFRSIIYGIFAICSDILFKGKIIRNPIQYMFIYGGALTVYLPHPTIRPVIFLIFSVVFTHSTHSITIVCFSFVFYFGHLSFPILFTYLYHINHLVSILLTIVYTLLVRRFKEVYK